MPIVSDGPFTAVLFRFAQTLADVTAFQVFCGVSGAGAAAQALARIRLRSLPHISTEAEEFSRDDLRQLRPVALVDLEDRADESIGMALGGARTFQSRGTLTVRFEREVPEELWYNEPEIVNGFLRETGAIYDGLKAIGGTERADPEYCYMDIMAISAEQMLIGDMDHSVAEGVVVSQLFRLTWVGQ